MTRVELLQIAKPILFNTDMVKAILEGRKTVTRRLVKPKQLIGFRPDRCPNGFPEEFIKEKPLLFKPYCDMTDAELIKTIYIEPCQLEDILYVRETWSEWTDGYVYKAWSNPFPQPGKASVMKWKPSLHMPKDAARIFLKVKDVRVERLRDITGEQAVCEGTKENFPPLAVDEFRDIWNSTIKKADLTLYDWNANPWVWVIEFERIEPDCEV